MYSKDFSIILIIKDDHEALQGALNALSALEYPKEQFEVIVVDDGSSPSIAEKISLDYDFSLQYLHLTREPRSSRSRARNRGAELAQYDYLVFIDGDHLVEGRFLQSYCKYFTFKPRERVVAGTRRQVSVNARQRMLGSEGMPANLPFDNDIRLHVRQVLNRPFFQLAGHWHLFWSCNFCIEKSLYQQIGGFDEDFIEWGLEDSEFGYRLFKSAIKVDLLDNYIWHVPAKRPYKGAEQYRAWMNNLGLFYGKHPKPEVLAQMSFEDIYFNQPEITSRHKPIDWLERYLAFEEKVSFFTAD